MVWVSEVKTFSRISNAFPRVKNVTTHGKSCEALVMPLVLDLGFALVFLVPGLMQEHSQPFHLGISEEQLTQPT